MVLVWGLIGAMGELNLSKRHIGLIFDGKTEDKAIPSRLSEKNCKFHKRIRNVNGKSVTLKRISQQCIRLLNALDKRGVKLSFVIVDKEDRQELALQIGKNLTSLIASGYSGHFIVVVADIMFENWLVADIESIKAKYPHLIKDNVTNSNRDGKHGEGIIQKSWKGDGKFRKTIHGPKFFKAIRIEEASNNSPSFNYFISQLKNNKVDIY